MYLTLLYVHKKSALASDSIASCALIIENKLTTYYILGYNSESLKNNPMRNREVMRVMERVYNFSAGPSILPLPVLEKVQKELLNYNGQACLLWK